MKRRGKGKKQKRDKKRANHPAKAPLPDPSHLEDHAWNSSPSSHASTSASRHHRGRQHRQQQQHQHQHNLSLSPVALYNHPGPAPSSQHFNDYEQSPPPPSHMAILPHTLHPNPNPSESAASCHNRPAGMISETRLITSGSGPRIPRVLVPVPSPRPAALVQEPTSNSRQIADERDYVYRRRSGSDGDDNKNRET